MAQLVDSSVFIALERASQGLRVLLGAVGGDPIALAAITASELLFAVHRADSTERQLRREAFVEAILERVPVLPFDLRVARTHAELAAHLAGAGRPIGAHDLLIAATALGNGLEVLTHNLRDFRRVPGLVVHELNW